MLQVLQILKMHQQDSTLSWMLVD